MEVLLIAGPASVALDRARVMTNTSTGRTGVLLAESLRKHGLHITLWYGRASTYPLPTGLHSSERFQTVHDLEKLLQKTVLKNFSAILLPAALPDYDLATATDLAGRKLSRDKWPGHLQGIHIELKPAPRILNKIRAIAPKVKIIGWKWEADGSKAEILKAAKAQISECHTDACILNGPAYGDGYLFLESKGESTVCPDPEALGHVIAGFLKSS